MTEGMGVGAPAMGDAPSVSPGQKTVSGGAPSPGARGPAPQTNPTSPTDTGSSTAPPQGGSSTPANPAPNWLEGLGDETKGYIERKGFKSPADVVAAYQNSEKLISKIGGDWESVVKVPGKDATPEERQEFHKRLGVPESPDEYGLQVPEGSSGEFAKWAADHFHKANLTPDQANTLANSWNEYVASQNESAKQAAEQAVSTQVRELKQEWGSTYDKNIATAQDAVKRLGVAPEQIDALQKVMGFDGVMKFFQNIGTKTGEHTFVEGGKENDAGGFGSMTPQQGQAELARLKSDKEFMQKYTEGDVAARKKMDYLHQIAAAG